ncbi:DNA gyrase subunit A [Jeotgalicoccus nanhaiensis]|uniref:DNA gyrase subunit A n=1 Tax=Jeotgalicoccus nanhaiensis TaxID=568603 RepID=A0ABR9XXZ4_9STAP|nr:DNA gyrase subunit A [Jeotgalicoccus nanhaiensis]MBF0753656.1 DNA gyrase subunit A [Jeotgalicoccus nanhaiensis]TFU61821.1 DNA gyrase subunit A [Jeotgalicoccus nanhaiensis]
MADHDEQFQQINITKTMRSSFLSYAMSVIVSRALPDVRDGMKPVHRRILYGMHDNGMTSDKPFKKSARIVGDVMGKYHPHGDSSIYDAMVRMAQDFSYRYPLVHGQGNFGSMDGDGAAAMRYTEAKMSKISMELMRDINKDTVDFQPNYDENEREPSVLPARFPNLLVNGTSGIAVGMATNIPPHNLTEVINAVLELADNPNITTMELMEHVKGPDFPTAGLIIGKSGIKRAYETGHGSVIMRARCEVELMKNGKERIVISEIPYQVNKARLVEKIAELVRDKKIEGITDLRDETSLKEGVRIIIEIRKDKNANVILNNLYKQTPLQTSFGVNMLALVNGEPKVLALKEVLYHYLEHQKVVVTRRTKYELKRAEDRAHILEGLLIALDHIDEIIKTIRASDTDEEAKNSLMSQFDLSERQSQAILDMRLRRLTGLERGKIQNEYDEILKNIEYLKSILNDDEKLLEVIKEELTDIRERFGDERRTEITLGSIYDIEDEDLIPREQIVVTLSHNNYIKRLPASTYRAQHRGGRGIQGMNTIDDDFVSQIVTMSTHDYILFFTNTGRVYRLKGYEIPELSRQSKGLPIVNLIEIEKDEKISTMISVKDKDETEGYQLLFATKNGLVKRTPLDDFKQINKNGKIAISFRGEDELLGVRLTDGSTEVMLGTREGSLIRFEEEQVRSMGRTAAGVKGINLRGDDEVVGVDVLEPGQHVLIVTDKGYGKLTHEEEYRSIKRGGFGVKTANLTDKNGKLVFIASVDRDEDMMIVTDKGVIIRLTIDAISITSRNTQGVRLIRLDEEQDVATVAVVKNEIAEEELEDEGSEMAEETLEAEDNLEVETDEVEDNLDPESESEEE